MACSVEGQRPTYTDMADVNGELLAAAKASLPLLDRAVLFADAVYEVVGVQDGRPFRLGAHLQRLRRHCEALRFERVPSAAELARRAHRVWHACGRREGRIYLLVTRGVEKRRTLVPTDGLVPTVAIVTEPPAHPPSALYAHGATAIAVPEARWGRAGLKTTHQVPAAFARMEARAHGAWEALWVDDAGRVREGTATNVFAAVGTRLLTPPLDEGIVAGITRQTIVELAPTLGLSVEERPLTLDDLVHASEAMLTGTSTEVLPLVRVDGRTVGNGRPGPIARRLRAAYRALVRRESAWEEVTS